MIEYDQDFSFKRLFTPLTTIKAIFILFIVGFFIFFNSLFNTFVADDFGLIVNQPFVHSLSNIPNFFQHGNFYDESGQGNIYYKPLPSIFFTILYAFSGENAFLFHLIQLLIHITNAILVFIVFRNFFKKEISLLFSLIFLTHPINTEAVVYISALQENLFLLFGLISLYLTMEKSDKKYTTFTIPLLLLLSLLSKETGVIFLFIIPLFNYLYQKKGLLKSFSQSILSVTTYLFLRLFVTHAYFNNQAIIAPIQIASIWERLITIPKIILFYISTFIFPVNLVMFQTWTVKLPDFKTFYLPLVIDACFFLGLLIFEFTLFKKKQDLFKTSLFFSAWFLTGLMLHLQIIPLDETVADRWFYFPIIGLLGIIIVTIKYFDLKSNQLRILLITLIGVILLFSLRVINRNTDWNDSVSLYTHDALFNKDSYQIHLGLAEIANTSGDSKDAEQHYVYATKLFPSDKTFGTLGNFYLQNNQAKKAVGAYTMAQKYKSDSAFSWMYLAIAKYNAGDKKGAIEAVKKAYTILPRQDFLAVLKTMKNNEPISIQK